jgi:hypothetical protein
LALISAEWDFKARLTWVKLCGRAPGSLPAKLSVACQARAQGCACVAFPTHLNLAPCWSVVELSAGLIMVHSRSGAGTVSFARRPGYADAGIVIAEIAAFAWMIAMRDS